VGASRAVPTATAADELAVHTGLAISERIERLPLSSLGIRVLLLCCIAWLIEAFDIGLVGVVLPSLHQLYHLTPSQVGFLAAASTIGIVIGVIPSGMLADRFGRKQVLMGGLAWYTVITLVTALSPNIATVIALRLIAGVGMGAMFPMPYAYMSEFTSSRNRGAFTGILDAFLSAGYFISPALAALIIPHMALDAGWRVFFVLGGVPLVYVFVLWWLLPESPRWYEAKGRYAEAEAAMTRIERQVEGRIGRPLPDVERDRARPVVVNQVRVPVGTIFRRSYLRRTIMCWLALGTTFFVFYSIQVFMPTVIAKMGFSLTNAFLFTSIIVGVSVIGKFVEAYAVERWGRKPVIVSFTLIAVACALFFGYLRAPVWVLTVGIVMSFFGIGLDPAVKIYVAENYPTRVRATGVGFTEGVGRLFAGALAPYFFAQILASLGVGGSYVFVAAVAFIGVLAVGFLGEETKGRVLEEISQ
jgi:putative MFS transporter